ncbi:nucleotidyltransferase domain-containing protein [Streptomyces sp. ME19-03-3]|nr:nucleotidyltransferase domain-containing protein [Streptomyces sp. ME19-03-3]
MAALTAQIRAARTALSSTTSAAFIGGSVSAGLGTPTSDVDLFVLTPGGAQQQQQSIDGMRVDIEYIDGDSLSKTIAAIKQLSITPDADQMHRISPSALDICGRLLLGEILQDPREELASLRDSLIEDRSTFAKIRISHYAMTAANRLEDARGFAITENIQAELYSTWHALIFAAKAYSARQGDIYHGAKWVWSQWRRLSRRPEGTNNQSLDVPSDGNPVALRYLCQDLLVQAITGIDYPIIRTTAPGNLARNSYAAPLFFKSAVGLLREDLYGVSLSLKGLALWGYSHGRSENEAVEGFANKTGVPSPAVERYLKNLKLARVLEPSAESRTVS